MRWVGLVVVGVACGGVAACRRVAPPASQGADAAPRAVVADVPARDVPARDVPARDAPAVQAPVPAARVVRGRLRPTGVGERCETADGTVVHFDASQPLFSLDFSTPGAALRVSARTHGRVMLVASWATADDPSAVACSEAVAEGDWVTMPLSPGDGPVRVYAATRTGETGPFVAVLHATEHPPEVSPRPMESPAPGGVWARWQMPAEGCDGEACRRVLLRLSGATSRDIEFDAEMSPQRCAADTDAVAFGCEGGGLDALRLAQQGGGYVVTLAHATHGNCRGPCPTTRTRLGRFELPSGQRVVPHPAGVITW